MSLGETEQQTNFPLPFFWWKKQLESPRERWKVFLIYRWGISGKRWWLLPKRVIWDRKISLKTKIQILLFSCVNGGYDGIKPGTVGKRYPCKGILTVLEWWGGGWGTRTRAIQMLITGQYCLRYIHYLNHHLKSENGENWGIEPRPHSAGQWSLPANELIML